MPDERSAGVVIASLNSEINRVVQFVAQKRTQKIIRNSQSSIAAGNINLFNSDGKCGGALHVLLVRMRYTSTVHYTYAAYMYEYTRTKLCAHAFYNYAIFY